MREQILAEAAKQFAAKGFDGASLTTIADAVGVRKPSLLYHFPSKEALRRAVLVQILSCWRERVPRLLLAAASGKGQFEAVTGELVSFFVADPDRARLLLREALDRPEELRELLEAHVTPWVGTVCDQLRRGQQAGRVWGELDPEAYVVQVINLVIAGLATFHCMGALVPVDGGRPALERHLTELKRVARASLFRPTDRPQQTAPPEAAGEVEERES